MTTELMREVLDKHLVPKHDFIYGFADLTGIIDQQFGPRLRLVSVLTNTPLACDDQPIEKSRCGSCKICVEKCPARAISGKSWDISVDRDIFFDPFKCRQMCKEFGKKYLKMNVRVCGICVSVCPVRKS
jgi:epoxyqueuosine reductase